MAVTIRHLRPEPSVARLPSLGAAPSGEGFGRVVDAESIDAERPR